MMKSFFSYLRHQYVGVLKIIAFIFSILLVMWLIPHEVKFKFDFQQGKPWNNESLFAPFDFAILKTAKQIDIEKERVASELNPYFDYQEEETKLGRDRLIITFEKKWREFHKNKNDVRYGISRKTILKIYDSVQGAGLLQYHQILAQREPNSNINIVKDRVSKNVEINTVFTDKSAFDFASRVIDSTSGIDQITLKSILSDAFVQNLVFDENITKQELAQALNKVSTTYGMVQQGQLIISKGELIDDGKYAVLASLRAEYAQRVGSTSEQNMLILGQAVLIISVFLSLFLFLWILRRDVYSDLRKILLILVSMMMIIVPSFLIISIDPTWIMLFPFGILPIILITFFDTRIMMMVHLFTIMIIALAVPSAFSFVFIQLVIGFIVLFSLVNHNRRTYYFRTSVYILIAYAVLYFGFQILQEGDFGPTQINKLINVLSSAILTLLALPLIYGFERVFGMLTDLTLLEYSNTNSPLLRQLAQKAPGTFQHSMQVANLSEEALFVIGGDTLLARTGALYHDIGKMENQLYFIENQMGGYNPHDDLTAAESARIIIDHVVKGIVKARKAGLPEQIIDFIRTHHGDRRVEYFYFMEQKENPGLAIDESDFRYRGPIPFSKETAVVMMADSVEAAPRSIKNPTEQKLNDLVENIISKQMETNQFVNADITMREIITVKKILKKKLMNIYHVRIAYPD
ncbi:MAG: HDIG domain-containing protein [Bacteroidales bacterium]|nr:HDIG domain-containing protein [Bacteroidales bacterium]